MFRWSIFFWLSLFLLLFTPLVGASLVEKIEAILASDKPPTGVVFDFVKPVPGVVAVAVAQYRKEGYTYILVEKPKN
ncbi:MAG: hypothetical protein GXP19_03185 [Gammaproteobacteria bacterium]|nr:hypothetical protein [Gammaproteobacteria bacterium]